MNNKFRLLGQLIAEMPIWQKIVSLVVVLAVVVAVAMGIRAISYNTELTEAENNFDQFRVEESEAPTVEPTIEATPEATEATIEPEASVEPEASADPAASASPAATATPAATSGNVTAVSTKHNFSTLQKNNKDVYSWITVPGTKVDYPVLQNKVADYYLMRNMDGSQGYPGCLYTNNVNKQDYSDYITVIYGHNMKNKTMFGSLHSYDDPSFIKKANSITIETASQVIAYEVIAAVNYSDNRIDYYYEVGTKSGRDAFWKSVLDNKNSSGTTIAKDTLNDDDKLLVLSTCIGGKKDRRFLIIGRQVSATAR